MGMDAKACIFYGLKNEFSKPRDDDEALHDSLADLGISRVFSSEDFFLAIDDSRQDFDWDYRAQPMDWDHPDPVPSEWNTKLLQAAALLQEYRNDEDEPDEFGWWVACDWR